MKKISKKDLEVNPRPLNVSGVLNSTTKVDSGTDSELCDYTGLCDFTATCEGTDTCNCNQSRACSADNCRLTEMATCGTTLGFQTCNDEGNCGTATFATACLNCEEPTKKCVDSASNAPICCEMSMEGTCLDSACVCLESIGCDPTQYGCVETDRCLATDLNCDDGEDLTYDC